MLTFISAELFRLRRLFLIVQATMVATLSSISFIPILVSASETGRISPISVIGISATIISALTWLFVLRSNRVILAGFGLMITVMVAFFFSPITAVTITGSLALLTAALLLRRPYFYTVVALVILRLAFESSTVLRTPPIDYRAIIDLIISLMTLVLVAMVTRVIIVAAIRTIEDSSRIASALQAATDIGRTITQQADIQEMMRMTVNFIRDRYGFYHVQVFLLNETGDQAVLRASTGDIGYQLLQRRHQLTVGSQSVVGQAVLRGTPILVTDTGSEAVFFRNELLPNTHAEFTLPLKDGNRSFGALDVQSTSSDSFTDIDRRALEVIADLLSLAMRDARILAEQSQTEDENTRLSREIATLRRENERLNRELTQATWHEYLSQRSSISGIDLQDDQLVPSETWSPHLERASKQGETVTRRDVVAVPVVLRGEIIGAIEVDPGQSTAAETAEIAQAVAQRLAVSLESARLYEETRQAAYQEQQINEIAARFGTTGSIDELLRITLAELGETLGAQGGAIRLGRLDDGASAS